MEASKTKPKVKKSRKKTDVKQSELQELYEQAEDALQTNIEVFSACQENSNATTGQNPKGVDVLKQDQIFPKEFAGEKIGNDVKKHMSSTTDTSIFSVLNKESTNGIKVENIVKSGTNNLVTEEPYLLSKPQLKSPLFAGTLSLPVLYDKHMPGTSNIENCREKSESIVEEHPKIFDKRKIYPALKNDQDVRIYQSIVKAHTQTLTTKISIRANSSYQEFIRVLNIEKHEFFDLVRKFASTRQDLIDAQYKIKSLESKLKRQKNKLWSSQSKKATAKGKCDDGHVVDICHSYIIKKIDEKAFNELDHILLELGEKALSDFAFCTYTNQLVRLKIELYISDLLKNSNAFADKSSSSPLAALVVASPPSQYVAEITALKTCISILFSFQRRPINDEEFIITSRRWLTDLVAVLLRSGTLADSLFILNHILRCPAGISSWASHFVQMPLLPLWSGKNSSQRTFDSDYLEYALIVLYMMLHPVPDREDFLKFIKASGSQITESISDIGFVILDSDGEEIQDSIQFSREWTEEDIISLLTQVPISSVFQHVLLISAEDGNYDITRTSEEGMQKLLVFSTFLFDLLLSGLKTYSYKSYKLLTEMIGNLMRHTVHYVSDHWQNFKEANLSYNCGLQSEYDRLFFHAVHSMFTFQELGTWKFLATLPYACVSPKMLWNILWIFHCSLNESEETLYSEKDVDLKLRDDSVRQILPEKLSVMNPVHVLYLLKAFEKMALSRNQENDFVWCLTIEIFEVSFANDKLFDVLSKEGKICLSSITKKHPFVVSFLLNELKEASDCVINRSITLFKELSLSKWLPHQQDIKIISDWLLSGTLYCPQNQLARLILKRLNWNIEGMDFVLPIELHRQVAVLIVQAYSKYDTNGNNWIVSRGVDQMLQLCSTIRFQNVETDQGFVAWAWEVLFSLKLHVLDRRNPPWVMIFDGNVEADDIPDINRDPWLHALLRAYEEKQPAGCYIALVMTNIGHSIKSLSTEGLEIISMLVELKQYAAAIQSLYFILPFFAKDYDLLTTNQKFMTHLSDLILADQRWLNFASETVVGTVLNNIAAMIKNQIFQAWKITVECANPLLKMWMYLMVKLLVLEDLKGHQKLKAAANQVYYLLDIVVQIAFVHIHTRNGIQELMSSITRPLSAPSKENKKQSFWSQIFGNGDKNGSFLLPETSPDYSWFAWSVIYSETNQRSTQDLWFTVLNEMTVDSSISSETAFKKSSSILNITSLSMEYLPIYRWSSQALDAPIKHPILPLLWQQFFLYYFQRTTSSCGPREKGSLGPKFFKSGVYPSMLKKMQCRLKETTDYYYKFVERYSTELEHLLSESLKTNNTTSDSHKVSEKKCKSDLAFYQDLFLTFRAFSIWIEDSQLHNPNLCLPALEPKYLCIKLKLILQNDQEPWFELVQVDKIKEELMQKNNLWDLRKVPGELEILPPSDQTKSATASIMRHLSSYVCPLPLPSIKPLDLPFEPISDYMLSSWDVLARIVEHDQKIICDEAKNFRRMVIKLKNLNEKYVNLIPEEYKMEDFEMTQKKACYKSSKGVNGCSGPAVFHLMIKRVTNNVRVTEQIEQNRIQFHLVMSNIQKPPPYELCSAAMHMETCVRALLKKISTASPQESQMLKNMGISLFYLQIEQIEKAIASVANYSPSRQFFSSSLDLLGREFIDGQEDQCLPLAKTLLSHPSAAVLASSFFNPNHASVDVFLNIYKKLVKSIETASPSAVLVLLSKIDLEKWLDEQKAPSSFRKKLFKVIGTGLLGCGFKPEEDLLPIHELFKKHFRTILLYEFPDHYADAVLLLLEGTETGKLSVDVWYETFRCLGCTITSLEWDYQEIKNALHKFALNQHLSPDQQLFVSSQPLMIDQIVETLDNFHRHFMKMRSCCSDNFYKKYKEYIKPLAVFLGMMGHGLMELFCRESLSQVEISSNIEQLWKVLHCGFKPWIDPFESGNHLVFPWSPDDEAEAETMFRMFAICIEFHHQNLLGKTQQWGILSYVWNYYVRAFVNPGQRNYSMIVCHSALVSLPWDTFYPTEEDIKGMCDVLQSEIPESREFLSGITIKIPWMLVMTNLTEVRPSLVGPTLGILAKLLIISGWEYSVIKTNSHRKLIKRLENLAWYCVTPEIVGDLLDQYLFLCDPLNLLQDKSDDIPDVYILKFLKLVCGMVPSAQKYAQSHLEQKQMLYLNKYIKLISHCAESNSETIMKDPEKFDRIVPTLLREIELMILKDVPASEQMNSAVPLVREVLGILNNIEESRLQKKALDSAVSWLKSSPKSPLLLPCLKTACCCLTSMNHLVAIAECCISARFDTELQDPTDAQKIWHLASSCFQVPQAMHDGFLSACIEQTGYLTLYNYILNRFSQSSTSASNVLLLQSINIWIKRMKPSENTESKMLLLWDKVLHLALKLASENDVQAAQYALSSFCNTLSLLGEDRSQSGLWASVGLGKPSSLSVNFRFLCRALRTYILLQIPENGSLRLELMAPGYVTDKNLISGTQKVTIHSSQPHPSSAALKALEDLQNLLNNKSYTALKSQLEHAVACASNPKFCFVESRQLLKELALQVFPNQIYLHIMGT